LDLNAVIVTMLQQQQQQHQQHTDLVRATTQQQQQQQQLLEALIAKSTTPTVAAPQPTEAILVRHFEDAERRKLQTWRNDLNKCALEKEAWAGDTRESLLELFASRANKNLCTVEDALILHLLLAVDDAARLNFAATILRLPPRDRLRAHNFRVASSVGPAFLDTHGALLGTLAVPLYPKGAAFEGLNTLILNEGHDAPVGAGTGGSRDGFAKAFAKPQVTQTVVCGGECSLPVSVLPSGQQVVDLTQVEEAFKKLQLEVASLRRQVMANDNRRRQRPQPQQQYQQQQVHFQGQYYQPQQQAQYRGRGGARGGMRGGGDDFALLPSTNAVPSNTNAQFAGTNAQAQRFPGVL
jgi:hypothetical protein